MKDAKNRILVIDDEVSILCKSDLRLSRMGLEVKTVLTREYAIKKFNTNGYDLVLTDMIMPDISGSDVLNHIRVERKHSTPVITMSGTPWLLERIFKQVYRKDTQEYIIYNSPANRRNNYV